MGAFSYLDNITVAGHDQAEHDGHVTSFLKAIRRRDFTLNDYKTISSVKYINILGYVVGNMTIKPDPKRMPPYKIFLCLVIRMPSSCFRNICVLR